MKTILLFISILFALSAQSQADWSRIEKRDFADGDFAFYQADYSFACELFKPLHEKYSENQRLNWIYAATLLYLKTNLQEAHQLLIRSSQSETEALYHLGRSFHLRGEFESAMNAFTRYKIYEVRDFSDDDVDRQIAMCQAAKKLISSPVDVTIQNVGPAINSENKEYVPLITADGKTMYFTSRRKDSVAGLKDPNGEYYEDIYFSTLESGSWSTAKNVGLPINSETHDATVTISADGNSMVIYRTNNLYLCQLKSTGWSKPKKFGERINSEFQEASAALNQDGTIMIFSSNRPGGHGGKDLYRVKKLPNGEWSLPKNLGPNINTRFDEDAPFISLDGKSLYFSSNGHQTMGGYDIFRSTILEAEIWSVPENLGYPINSVDDDIYLTLESNQRIGYYSSNQHDGFGQLDIYRLEFVDRQSTSMVVKGEVMDLQGRPIKAKITILDEDDKSIQGVYNTNSRTGKFIIIVHPQTVYKVFIEAEEYRTQQDEIYYVFPEKDELEFLMAPYILMK
jgi:hypothetical protein